METFYFPALKLTKRLRVTTYSAATRQFALLLVVRREFQEGKLFRFSRNLLGRWSRAITIARTPRPNVSRLTLNSTGEINCIPRSAADAARFTVQKHGFWSWRRERMRESQRKNVYVSKKKKKKEKKNRVVARRTHTHDTCLVKRVSNFAKISLVEISSCLAIAAGEYLRLWCEFRL